jgi:hypothetical protein
MAAWKIRLKWLYFVFFFISSDKGFLDLDVLPAFYFHLDPPTIINFYLLCYIVLIYCVKRCACPFLIEINLCPILSSILLHLFPPRSVL